LTDVDPDTSRIERVRAQTLTRVLSYVGNRVQPDEAADVVSEAIILSGDLSAKFLRSSVIEHALGLSPP